MTTLADSPSLADSPRAQHSAATTAVYITHAVQATTPVEAPSAGWPASDLLEELCGAVTVTLPTFDVEQLVGNPLAEARSVGVGGPLVWTPCHALETAVRHYVSFRSSPAHETIGHFLLPCNEVAQPLDRVTEEGLAPADDSDPEAFRRFREIGEWLDARDEEVAGALGLGRTTPYSWRRDGCEPQRGTAQRLHEFHAVLSSLRRRLGAEALLAWLSAGQPKRRDLLLEGRLDALAGEVDAVLFGDRATRPDLSWGGEDTGPVDSGEQPAGEPPRASRRSARRARRRR